MKFNAHVVSQHITLWLRSYCKESMINGMVVGVSGGIDSAVTSLLAARTGLPLLLVDIPIHQEKKQRSRGIDHMKKLSKNYSNVEWLSSDMSDVFDVFSQEMLHVYGKSTGLGLSLANARARLRMTTLYFHASERNSIVVGTGNKIEDFGVGFFTKYGDGGVDISPIADLMKSEVYKLGAYLGVSDSIMKAPPTDGLWGDRRTDEEQMGATYPELEWAMNFDGNQDTLGKRQKEVLSIFRRLNKVNSHKMKPIPICKIGNSLKYKE